MCIWEGLWQVERSSGPQYLRVWLGEGAIPHKCVKFVGRHSFSGAAIPGQFGMCVRYYLDRHENPFIYIYRCHSYQHTIMITHYYSYACQYVPILAQPQSSHTGCVAVVSTHVDKVGSAHRDRDTQFRLIEAI